MCCCKFTETCKRVDKLCCRVGLLTLSNIKNIYNLGNIMYVSAPKTSVTTHINYMLDKSLSLSGIQK